MKYKTLALTLVSTCALIFSSCNKQPEKRYNIQFVDDDEVTILYETTVKKGQVPVYEGAEPTKESTAQYSYSWTGWNPAIEAATKDQIYVATYDQTLREYQITFLNGDGSVLQSSNVAYGTVPTCSETPTKQSTAQYSYTFDHWNPTPVAVTGPATYAPEFTNTVRSYTVQFKNGDEVLQSETLEYGSTPEYKGDEPTKAATADYTYRFEGWDSEIQTVTGDQTYNAKFHELDSHLVCTECGKLIDGEKAIDYAITGTVADTSGLEPCKGFEKVYARDGFSSGPVGANLDISKAKRVYFALYHDMSYAYVYGGSNSYATCWKEDWYQFLLEKDNNGKWQGFYKKAIDSSWGTALIDAGDQTQGNLSQLLKVYNWSETAGAFLACSEVYVIYSEKTIVNYGGDTTKLSVVNGTVGLPGNVDYSIISNNYGTDDNSLVISGNANPGAAEITIPAVNFNEYMAKGSVTFTFGVKNNNEKMYFGAGDSKVDLGSNSASSQSDNNSGYVNWKLTVDKTGASVYNVNEARSISIVLPAAVMSGNRSIILSGGATSIYRIYFVTNVYFLVA